jgi:hypothetical protein
MAAGERTHRGLSRLLAADVEQVTKAMWWRGTEGM